MKNKYGVLYVKNYLLKIMESVALGIFYSRNFEKQIILFLVIDYSIIGVILQ